MKTTSTLALTAAALLASCASGPTTRAVAPSSVAPAPVTPGATSRTQATDAAPAASEDSPWERFSIGLGGLLVGMDSTARFGPAGAGIQISLEDLLGMDTSTNSFRLEGAWRFSKNRRHRVSASWIDLGRSGETVLGQDITIGKPVTNCVFADGIHGIEAIHLCFTLTCPRGPKGGKSFRFIYLHANGDRRRRSAIRRG